MKNYAVYFYGGHVEIIFAASAGEASRQAKAIYGGCIRNVTAF